MVQEKVEARLDLQKRNRLAKRLNSTLMASWKKRFLCCRQNSFRAGIAFDQDQLARNLIEIIGLLIERDDWIKIDDSCVNSKCPNGLSIGDFFGISIDRICEGTGEPYSTISEGSILLRFAEEYARRFLGHEDASETDLISEYCAATWDYAEGNVHTVDNPFQASQDRDEDSNVFYRLETTHLVHQMCQDVGHVDPGPFWGWMALEVAEATRDILRESLQGKKTKLGSLSNLHGGERAAKFAKLAQLAKLAKDKLAKDGDGDGDEDGDGYSEGYSDGYSDEDSDEDSDKDSDKEGEEEYVREQQAVIAYLASRQAKADGIHGKSSSSRGRKEDSDEDSDKDSDEDSDKEGEEEYVREQQAVIAALASRQAKAEGKRSNSSSSSSRNEEGEWGSIARPPPRVRFKSYHVADADAERAAEREEEEKWCELAAETQSIPLDDTNLMRLGASAAYSSRSAAVAVARTAAAAARSQRQRQLLAAVQAGSDEDGRLRC
ncbi:hypothetical protein B484DRAFT_401521 [Ochromonadaceae sp. CCMP2298]|nr:hypothetical protein B484DRAFT_401521 [Ochromonadaceae sp. CCMP2298]